ncbi:MAG: hypothetical protein ACREHE_08960 [Rhizomicrobium sp.]
MCAAAAHAQDSSALPSATNALPQAVQLQATQPQGAAASSGKRISVAPGYTLALAKGWSECDATINAQDGGAPLPDYFQKMCATPPKDMTVPIIKPELGGFSVLMVGSDADGASDFRHADDATLLAVGDKLCKSHIFGEFKISQCAFRIMTVAGRTALAGTILAPGGNGLAMKMRAIVIPEDGQSLTMFIFARAALGTLPENFGEDPDVEAMIASIAPQ